VKFAYIAHLFSIAYSQLFPHRVGRIAMDGMEYVKDGRKPWGWGLTSLDNVTDAWEQGFLGECVKAGSSRCALAEPHGTTITALTQRMDALFDRLIKRPIPGFTADEGPGLVTYESVMEVIYSALYDPTSWPKTARMLVELDNANATLALMALNRDWSYDPRKIPNEEVRSQELILMVICVGACSLLFTRSHHCRFLLIPGLLFAIGRLLRCGKEAS
jgi:hypothetical protein